MTRLDCSELISCLRFLLFFVFFFFFSSRRRHTRYIGDWSSDVCSSDLIVSEPTMLPFLSAVNCPLLLAVVTNVCLFDADGFFPPPFTHSYVIDSVALHVTVSTEPDSSPASLNLHTRLDPLSEAELTFLMKF